MGSVFDRHGHQTRSFTLLLKGTWSENLGILEEWFEFDDGKKAERRWYLESIDNQLFVGKADDVVGVAKGAQRGNVANSLYRLKIPHKGAILEVNMNDWLYAITSEVILNRVRMTKFGFTVGEMVIFMKKKAKNETK